MDESESSEWGQAREKRMRDYLNLDPWRVAMCLYK